ncbi:hypothetical protein ACFV3E_36640 [Streptomyces sp. NPDC059718]
MYAQYTTAAGKKVTARSGMLCTPQWTCTGCGKTEFPRSRDLEQAASSHASSCRRTR